VKRKHSYIFQSLKSKLADGCHFEKSLNRHNSATVGRIGTKFGTMMHLDPLRLSIVKISNFWAKFKMADGRHAKTAQSPCIGNGSIDLHETGHVDAFWTFARRRTLTLWTVLSFLMKFLGIQDCGPHHIEKPLNCPNSAMVRQIAMKFAIKTYFDPLKPCDRQNIEPRWRRVDARTCPRSIYSSDSSRDSLNRTQNRYCVDADWDGYIGATWRTRLNRPLGAPLQISTGFTSWQRYCTAR